MRALMTQKSCIQGVVTFGDMGVILRSHDEVNVVQLCFVELF